MLKSQQSRLEALEQHTTADAAPLFVWGDTHESTSAAIERAYPAGVPDGARLIVLRWGNDAGGLG
jgi:hypothetical protein